MRDRSHRDDRQNNVRSLPSCCRFRPRFLLHSSQGFCAGTRLAFTVFEACYRADAPTLMATAAALLLPDANAALDARCEAPAGAGRASLHGSTRRASRLSYSFAQGPATAGYCKLTPSRIPSVRMPARAVQDITTLYRRSLLSNLCSIPLAVMQSWSGRRGPGSRSAVVTTMMIRRRTPGCGPSPRSTRCCPA